MRGLPLALPSLFVLFCLFTVLASPALALQATSNPTLIVSFQQDKIRINRPVYATVLLANDSDLALTGARLVISGPDFIQIHPDSCDRPVHDGPFQLAALEAHSVMEEPQRLCFTINKAKAVSDSYNLLFSVIFSQGSRTGIVTQEKPLQVDLIGAEVILGVPLAFAGFVLPGLMLLIALRWFKLPWFKDIGLEDRVIYGVLITLVMLGPFSLLARRTGAASWIQWLDIQQEISIERLVVYTASGLVLGVLIGGFYQWADRRRKIQTAAYLETLKFKDGDTTPQLIYKCLKLNPHSLEKKFYFEHKKDGTKIYGYHYAMSGDSVYIFPSFQLILSRLEEPLRALVRQVAQPGDTFCTDSARILAVMKLLDSSHAGAFRIEYPVEIFQPDGTSIADYSSREYIRIDGSLYSQPPPYLTEEAGCLLELLEREPY